MVPAAHAMGSTATGVSGRRNASSAAFTSPGEEVLTARPKLGGEFRRRDSARCLLAAVVVVLSRHLLQFGGRRAVQTGLRTLLHRLHQTREKAERIRDAP